MGVRRGSLLGCLSKISGGFSLASLGRSLPVASAILTNGENQLNFVKLTQCDQRGEDVGPTFINLDLIGKMDRSSNNTTTLYFFGPSGSDTHVDVLETPEEILKLAGRPSSK